MKLINEIIGDNIIICLSDSIDGKSVVEIQKSILSLEKKYSGLLLDMESVAYLSGAGLRALLFICRQSNINQKKIALLKITAEVREIMYITGFLEHFIVFDDKEAAIKWLQE